MAWSVRINNGACSTNSRLLVEFQGNWTFRQNTPLVPITMEALVFRLYMCTSDT